MRTLVVLLLIAVSLSGCAGGEYVQPEAEPEPVQSEPEPVAEPEPDVEAEPEPSEPVEESPNATQQPAGQLVIFVANATAGEPFNVSVAYFQGEAEVREDLSTAMRLNGIHWNITFSLGNETITASGTESPATVPVVLAAGNWSAEAWLDGAGIATTAQTRFDVAPAPPTLIWDRENQGFIVQYTTTPEPAPNGPERCALFEGRGLPICVRTVVPVDGATWVEIVTTCVDSCGIDALVGDFLHIHMFADRCDDGAQELGRVVSRVDSPARGELPPGTACIYSNTGGVGGFEMHVSVDAYSAAP